MIQVWIDGNCKYVEVEGQIILLKDTTRELVGKSLEAITKLAVNALGDRQLDGSKLLARGNIEYRLQDQQLCIN
ncbi:MAG: hypothetical protein V7K48_28670 [Nostoc sp.]|uniref:hypothetical protein n=1 Tax=Nostoc sp. TaxID=1180 RepID=UPI002FF485F0